MTGGWKFAATSNIGTSHLKGESPVCQDAYRCIYLEESDALLCVVSDGAGSAFRAEQGATLTCQTVVTEARAAESVYLFTEEFARRTLEVIRSTLTETAEHAGLRIRDYACTLLVAVATSDRVAFWQLGDGAICVRQAGTEEFLCPFWPAKGEYANQTNFVTDHDAANHIEVETEAMVIADLALFSDGLERLALDFTKRTPHKAFFTALFPYLHRRPEGHQVELEEQMSDFLASSRVNAKTDDDKTLILASRENVRG